MLRRCAMFLVLFATFLAPPPALAQSSEEAIVGDVGAYWAGAFASAGIPYAWPGVVAVTGPIETSCGVIDPSFGPGAYCPTDQTIFYTPGWFDLSDPSAGFALYTVVAHEWGHHVQQQLGLFGGSKDGELQADCLAGAYLQTAEARGLISSGMLSQAVGFTALAGDLSFLPVDGVAHGSPSERAISLMTGFQSGPTGCGVW